MPFDPLTIAFVIPSLVMGIVGWVRSAKLGSRRGVLFGAGAIGALVLGLALSSFARDALLAYTGLALLLVALAASIVSLVLAAKARPARAVVATPAGAVVLAGHTNGLALASVIVVWFSTIVGLILGHVALGQIRRTGEEGRGMALTAVVAGWILTGLIVIASIFAIASGVWTLSVLR